MAKKTVANTLEKIQPTKDSNPPLVVNPDRQAEIIRECDLQGLTLAHLIKTVYEGTKANRTTVDKFGEEHVEPDVNARLKAVGIAFDLRGETNIKNNDINVIHHNIVLVRSDKRIYNIDVKQDENGVRINEDQ